MKLYEIEIDFSYQSLCLLLQIVKIPEFRHNINTIFFRTFGIMPPPKDEIDEWEWYRDHVERKERDDYERSSEAIYLLTEILRYLSDARELSMMELLSNYNVVVFKAMDLAQFPKRTLFYLIEPRRVLDQKYEEFGRSSASFARYMKWTTIMHQTPQVEWHRFVADAVAPNGGEDEGPRETAAERRIRKADEYEDAIDEGYHVRDYRLNDPHVASFFHGLSTVPHLYIDGCDRFPRLRFCNACNDIFAYSIIRVPFTQLTTLEIGHMYVSGGRLQHFIKRHSHTLKNIEFDGTILTDGSWKTIARVLRQISGLEHLRLLNDLCQKANAHPTKRRPQKYVPYDGWRTPFDTHAAVRRFLKDFIKFFSTSRYVYKRVPLRPLPQYYKVDLFHLPSR
ncbi:hypothetical protein J4E90_004549 [Alternaria incomplexa]|uniref:uncharacterized protein n=1 Tax=Alternaria incomplexa TaxID=1187928 RepID=UPI00221FB195|nr:uncharacterized protein J4E90_004549 [Alternaria incomplexa]KAI4916103.1 hypothetical protein J4E90_004549 [Alternaria incomplexa]